jgi:basic membrane protein A
VTASPASGTVRSRRRRAVPAAAFTALLAVVAGCGSPPATTGGATPAPSGSASPAVPDTAGATSAAAGGATTPATGATTAAAAGGGAFKACMVLDVGGVDDRSFNQSAWAGMNAAKKANPDLAVSYVSSASQNDYTPNLANETKQGCKTTIAVGGLMTDAVTAVAKGNPTANYAIIDSLIPAPNVYSLEFNTAQGAFLGGYLAAGMTKTGKVGTFGGLKIPPVTVYMDGYWEGVQYYNKAKGKNVAVLGWNETTQNGTFSNSFTDSGAGSTATRTLQQQGADIVFPVAGGSGLGAGAVAQSAGGKLNLIWVDTDGCVSAAQYCKYFVSTVFKDITGAVQTYLGQATKGTRTGAFVGNLANKGTGLSPFHEFDAKVPADLKSELTQLSADIAGGKVKVGSKAQPSS